MDDLFDLFMEMDDNTHDDIKAPFYYPGSKEKSLPYLDKHLPYRRGYVSVFGGSGIDLLHRAKSKTEVFNDRHSGITAFYRCLRDRLPELLSRLEITIKSSEEFYYCKDTWQNINDDLERAARWYYMLMNSFSGLGRNFGRLVKNRTVNPVLRALPLFEPVHQRLQDVQIENLDFRKVISIYSAPDVVFYLDPTYLTASRGAYLHEMARKDHQDMIDLVLNSEGYFAISGYENDLYDKYFDRVDEWEILGKLNPASSAGKEGNNKKGHSTEYVDVKECLWVYES